MAQDTEWTPVSHDTCDQVAGPFYHGTRADLAAGELLSAGGFSPPQAIRDAANFDSQRACHSVVVLPRALMAEPHLRPANERYR